MMSFEAKPMLNGFFPLLLFMHDHSEMLGYDVLLSYLIGIPFQRLTRICSITSLMV
jgi:hypothetical protein